jgi:hypothetical protein
MTSVMSHAPSALPALPDPQLRDRLQAVHAELRDLAPVAPPGRTAALLDALDAIEAELAALGCPVPPGPLTARDEAFLAALGCPE